MVQVLGHNPALYSEVMVHTAADVLRVNHPAGQRVKLIPKLSLDLTPADIPQPVSLLVTETFDAGLLGKQRSFFLHRTLVNIIFVLDTL